MRVEKAQGRGSPCLEDVKFKDEEMQISRRPLTIVECRVDARA
jgi:hypothetical protein